ncbi:MAG TPA: FadR/GntR family transcriptional regulator [Sphingomonas sp.]
MSKSDTGRLYARVSTDLGAQIAEGVFPVGARLPSERHLAQTYGVSRPTVREAIIALELDGLVEVKMGSGVYVVSRLPKGGQASETDMGPFELLEARRAIEGETCALAATHIDADSMAELEALVAEMDAAAADIAASEAADRRFHVAIASATGNSALVAAVEMLWDARARSPQYRLLSDKAHTAGVMPRLDEHVMILEALRSKDADAARAAMRSHLTRVLDSLLEATEVQELEQARARVDAQRRRYVAAR